MGNYLVVLGLVFVIFILQRILWARKNRLAGGENGICSQVFCCGV